MSPSHRRGIAQKTSDSAQNFEICMGKLESSCFYLFYKLCLSIFTHFMSMLRDFLAIFLRKGFKNKIVTSQKKIYFYNVCSTVHAVFSTLHTSYKHLYNHTERCTLNKYCTHYTVSCTLNMYTPNGSLHKRCSSVWVVFSSDRRPTRVN